MTPWWKREGYGFRPPRSWGHPKDFGREIQIVLLFSQNPTTWASTLQTPLELSNPYLTFWAELEPPRPLRTPGVLRSLYHFCHTPLQYGCLWTPLDPTKQDLTFWADLGPQSHLGHWGCAEVPSSFLSHTPTIWASMNYHGPQQDLAFWADSGPPRH